LQEFNLESSSRLRHKTLNIEICVKSHGINVGHQTVKYFVLWSKIPFKLPTLSHV